MEIMIMVEEQAAAPEESGWTSYLRCPSISQLSDSSFTSPQHPSIDMTSLVGLGVELNNDFQVAADAADLNRHFHVASQKDILHLHKSDDQLAAQYYECKGVNTARAPSMHDILSDHHEDASCGSSTLSDANSSSGSHPQPKQLKRKRKRHLDSKFAASPAALLEDTATSSPCSEQANKLCNRSDTFACDEEGKVSKRFKALQALIPCLKEMVGKEKEEEMLNAIISHVRALEQKVQVLLDVWSLTQLNHGLSPLTAHVNVD
ncbi:hypothetical protein GOP47_0000526 [Adiantum capillus-veneris]|uniref:BHLH domain-containing protein n=1 Tax=Adiantum capillus-veneris TaxID=13818 RepID=A0A9D4VFB0_ADICA|nr:hypothetical protein GOP47_0000526 [Adiantum capillus-veneris]